MVKYSNDCILISECTKKKGDRYLCRFHGAYRGDLVKKIEVTSDIELKMNEIYVMHLKVSMIKDFILYGFVKRIKILEDYTWI